LEVGRPSSSVKLRKSGKSRDNILSPDEIAIESQQFAITGSQRIGLFSGEEPCSSFGKRVSQFISGETSMI